MSTEPKQLIIVSGKGGTGKTSICAALAHLLQQAQPDQATVWVDADVDAANLGLVLHPSEISHEAFIGSGVALIDPLLCDGCGMCETVCRYDAVLDDERYPGQKVIDPIACDGCAACVYACPQDAIHMEAQQEGFWFHSSTGYGDLFHAELFPGKENSGKLVTLVKQQARLHALDHDIPLLVIDGPPGIGCPVISATSGVDLGLIVTEPSLAAIHDLARVYQTLKHFKIPAVICINKADMYPQGVAEIKAFAEQNDLQVIAEIPFDSAIPKAMTLGLPVNQHDPQSEAARAVTQLWQRLAALLQIREVV